MTPMLLLKSRFGSLLSFMTTALFVGSIGPAAVQALTIDFEDFAHGDVVDIAADVTITADNFELPSVSDYAVAFDSGLTGTADADLESASGGATLWSGGNLVGEDLGIMLILQEDPSGCDTGVCDSPDDEGSRPAGTLTLDFAVATPFLGFDLVDIESTVLENGELTLTDSTGASGSISFDVLLAGLEIGNNTANRIAPIDASELGLEDIVTAEFLLGGSGAIDNITIVPEPGPALLMALGLSGLGYAGRRRA
jgi:hypothetical protein